jgi:hypothetical protein
MPFGQMNKESYPVGSKIRFQFPERKTSIPVAQPHLFHHHRKIEQDALTLWWYDGGQPDPAARGGHDLSNKPPIEVTADIIALYGEVPDSGCVMIGDHCCPGKILRHWSNLQINIDIGGILAGNDLNFISLRGLDFFPGAATARMRHELWPHRVFAIS